MQRKVQIRQKDRPQILASPLVSETAINVDQYKKTLQSTQKLNDQLAKAGVTDLVRLVSFPVIKANQTNLRS